MLTIALFSISIQWASFWDDHSCTWVYQLCNMFCLFHGQNLCAQLILIGHQSGWLAPAFRWLVCGLPMCVRHFVVVWKPIAWGQFFLFNMAWVDACSLITPFKCVITRRQQCLVPIPKERDRWVGGQMWHPVGSIFGSCHGNQKWKSASDPVSQYGGKFLIKPCSTTVTTTIDSIFPK